MTSIWWIRRDLRLTDNLTLQAALKVGSIIPVFILDPHLLSRTPARRQNFLFEGLHVLHKDLQKRGSYLVIRKGNPVEMLHSLLTETGAQTIFAEEDFTPYARKRDEQVAQSLPLKLVQGQLVHHPLTALKAD
jgi:deoxyribodipyrimidine photo-lyase